MQVLCAFTIIRKLNEIYIKGHGINSHGKLSRIKCLIFLKSNLDFKRSEERVAFTLKFFSLINFLGSIIVPISPLYDNSKIGNRPEIVLYFKICF